MALRSWSGADFTFAGWEPRARRRFDLTEALKGEAKLRHLEMKTCGAGTRAPPSFGGSELARVPTEPLELAPSTPVTLSQRHGRVPLSLLADDVALWIPTNAGSTSFGGLQKTCGRPS